MNKSIKLLDHGIVRLIDHQVYAQAILELIKPIVPVAVEAFEAGRHE